MQLFDHLVGTAEERDRDGEAQRLGRLEVNDQLDFSGLLDGQVSRFLALENSPCVDASQAVTVPIAASIAHQASGCGEWMILENRGDRVAERQCGEPLAPGREELMGADHESTCPHLDQRCKGRIEVALGASLQDMKLKRESAGRDL